LVPVGRALAPNRFCLFGLAPDGGLPSAQGRAQGDAVKPVAEQTGRAQAGGLADQNQESGPEGVLGVLCMAQDPSTNAKDHGAVSAHQGLKGRLIALLGEALKQVGIGSPVSVLIFKNRALMLDGVAPPIDRHGFHSETLVPSFRSILP
jgi:hypothetical protein